MAIKWPNHLPIVGLLFVFLIAGAACGGDDPIENDDPNQENALPVEDCESDDDCLDGEYCIHESCYDQEPVECDANADCGGTMHLCVDDVCYHSCLEDEHCGDHMMMCDEGVCVEDPAAECLDHDDCGSDYCHDGACVSEGFICTLQNCAGQRGVCDPEAGAEGPCINADHCNSLDACIEDHLCIENECVEEEIACADCEDNEVCDFDPDTLTVECYDDTIICEPGHRECIDENTLYVCSQDGTIEQNIPCDDGCLEDELRCRETPGETCEDAIPAEHGDSFEFDWIEYGNTYEPDGSDGCIDPLDDLRVIGSDVTFELEIGPDQVGVVEVYTPFDNTMIYMFDDCPGNGTYSCQDPTGHTVEQLDGEVRRSFWYENLGDEAETIYVVADSAAGASSDDAVIDITISDQVCTPGLPVCSDGELGECSTQGTHYLTDSDLSCELGCYSDDPADGWCEAKPHATCDEALVFEGDPSESFTHDIIDFSGDEFWNTGNCLDTSIGAGNATEFDGRTAYFEVDMSENERLNASLASQFNAGLWVRAGCDGFCQTASNQSDDVEHIEYVAEEDETVYVVVHAVDDEVQSGEFTLDLTVDAPLCDGYDDGDILGCVDDSTIHYCTGSDYPEQYHCDGDCEDGACVEPGGDHCIDAIAIDGDDSVQGSFADVSDSMRHPTCGGADLDETPVGPDTIFELEIDDPNQLIQVDLTTTSDGAGVYLLDACPAGKDDNDFSDECIAGDVPTDDTEFFVEDPGTYYLVVDSSNEFDQAQFTLDVDVVYSDCLPHAERCHDGNLELCSEGAGGDFTYQVIQDCLVTCDELQCVGPDDANNRCGPGEGHHVDAPGIIEDDFDRFSSQPQENLDEGECFDDGTSGPDAFYRVELEPEQGVIVDATVDISGSHEAALYLADGCPTDSGVDCAVTDVFEESGTLEFYSPDGGIYDVGIAGITSFTSGSFILEFDFFDGQCHPEQDNVCIGDTAEQCTELGELEQIDCEYGCADGECLDKEGDFCARPFDIDEEGTVEGDGTISFELDGAIGGYTDAYNPYDDGDSCTGHVGDGPDVVFAFEGWADDEVDLTLTSQYDSAIWVTTDCDDAAASCIAGADDVFGPSVDNPEELSFTVPHHGTYYVIADAVQTGATGDFTFNATIDPGPQLTDPTFELSDDALELEAKVDEQDSATFHIENDGEMDLSFVIDEDADWLDVTPIDDTVDGESSTDITVTATCSDVHGTYTETLDIDTNAPFDGEGAVDITLECWDYGALDVDVQGLPSDVDHDIDVEDDDGNTVGSLNENGELDELEPGTYHLVPESVTDTDTGLVYEADPVDDLAVGSAEVVETTVEYLALPYIEISDDSLSLEAKVDEADSASFDIDNDGDQDLAFDIDEDADWLDVSPESGTVAGLASTTVSVDATCPDTHGTYSETIDVNANASNDSTVTVEITLECWDVGALDVDVQGLPTDVDHDIDVEDDDGNTVGSLDENGELDELEPGTYHLVPESVTDTDTGLVYEADPVDDLAVGSAEVVETTVEYLALPYIELSDDSLSLEAKVEEVDSASFNIENDGDQQLEFDIDEDADWLDVSPESGTVAGQASTTISVDATCPDTHGTYSETIDVNSNASNDSTVTVEISLECWDYGALDVDVQGLPTDVDHDIDVEDDDGNTVGALDENGELDELEPGTYHLVPNDVTDPDTGDEYEADPVDDIELGSSETVEETVEYVDTDD